MTCFNISKKQNVCNCMYVSLRVVKRCICPSFEVQASPAAHEAAPKHCPENVSLCTFSTRLNPYASPVSPTGTSFKQLSTSQHRVWIEILDTCEILMHLNHLKFVEFMELRI